MNVLHLEASDSWGGQEIRIFREMVALRDKGYSFFLGVQFDGELGKKAVAESIPTFEVDFRKRFWPFSFFKIWYYARKYQIDCIVTHSSLDAWLGGILGKFLRIPVLRMRHLSARIRKGINSIILYRYLADHVITTCEKIVPIICEQAKLNSSRCQSIPTGINPSQIPINPKKVKKLRDQLGAKPGDLIVGMVCFMRSWKGIEDFLKAAKMLESDKTIKWVLIGGGHIDTYRTLANKMNSKVHFTGHLDDPFSAIQALDVFALLSTANEGVSQASLQAAFLEKPLITTDTGGLGEVCVNGITGIKVPCKSSTSVAEAVVELQQNAEKRKNFGINAKKLVEEKFFFDKTLTEMEKVFQKLLKK